MKFIRYIQHVLIAGMLITFLFGCASIQQSAIEPKDVMNDPFHASITGQRLLADGDLEGAKARFDHALTMDVDYAPAISGLAQVAAAVGDQDQAFALAKKAVVKAAPRSEEMGQAQVTLMKIYLQFKSDGWIQKMEDLLVKQGKIYPKPDTATLVMGEGYEENGQYLKASVCYSRVIGWNRYHVQEADDLLARLYQRLRAEPGSRVGKQMADREEISRGDLSAFLVEELKLSEYLGKGTPVKYKAGFQTPEEHAQPKKEKPIPPDVVGHPFESDIIEVVFWEIRGLQPFPDGNFFPDDKVSRAGFALVVEDVLVRVKKEPLLKKAFLGSASPFPDVANDHYAFNAMVVCTTRDFLATNLDGAFKPDVSVSGTELLLAVRRLKEEIKGHQVKY